MNKEVEDLNSIIEDIALLDNIKRNYWDPCSIIESAAKHGKYNVIKKLLQSPSYLNESEIKINALRKACISGHLNIVKLLFESYKGTDVIHLLDRGYSYGILVSISKEGHIEILKFLFDNGYKYQENQLNIFEAFCCAAESGHLEIVKLFLTKGVKCENSNTGYNALLRAAGNGHLEVAKFLLEKRAEKASQLIEVATKIGHYDLVQLLLDSGCKITKSALFEATDYGHFDIAILLLKNGALIDWCSKAKVDKNKIKKIDKLKMKKSLTPYLLDNCPIVRYWAAEKLNALENEKVKANVS